MVRVFIILLLLFSFSVFGQNQKIDSLRLEAVKDIPAESKVDLLNEIAFLSIPIDPMSSKDEVIKAYNLANDIDYEQGQSRALVVMGGIHWSLADYNNALSHYLEALKQYEAQSDKFNQSICLNNIGEVYKKLKDYDNSLKYLTAALELKNEILGYGNISALAYGNLAEVYMLQRQYDVSEEYYLIAYESALSSGNKTYLAYVFEGLGNLNTLRKNYSEGIQNYQKAVQLRNAVDDYRGMAYAYLNLGDAYYSLSKFDSSRYYYDLSVTQAEKSSALDVRLKLYNSMSRLDSANANYQNAYLNYLSYSSLKDSIYNNEKSLQILRMQMEYENEFLVQDNEAKAAEVKQRNTLIIAVFMLLLFTLALAYTFNKRRTYQKDINKTLSQKNDEIEKQHQEIQSQTAELKALNENLASLNQNLESKIKQRTELLELQNKELAKYAFFHAHELRAPLSNILGLTDLLKSHKIAPELKETVDHLFTATTQLDQVIRTIASKESEDQSNDSKS